MQQNKTSFDPLPSTQSTLLLDLLYYGPTSTLFLFEADQYFMPQDQIIKKERKIIYPIVTNQLNVLKLT